MPPLAHRRRGRDYYATTHNIWQWHLGRSAPHAAQGYQHDDND
jgi:hypothetical protein